MLKSKIQELMAKHESLQMLWAVVRFFSISAMVIVILMQSLELYLWYKMDYVAYRGRKFTKETWAIAQAHDPDQQREMYTDLVTNHLKLGMKLKDVENLIGSKGPIYCLDKKVKCYLHTMNFVHFWVVFMSSSDFSVCFNEKGELIGVGRDCYYQKVCSHGRMSCILAHEPCECFVGRNGHIPCPPNFEKW